MNSIKDYAIITYESVHFSVVVHKYIFSFPKQCDNLVGQIIEAVYGS